MAVSEASARRRGAYGTDSGRARRPVLRPLRGCLRCNFVSSVTHYDSLQRGRSSVACVANSVADPWKKSCAALRIDLIYPLQICSPESLMVMAHSALGDSVALYTRQLRCNSARFQSAGRAARPPRGQRRVIVFPFAHLTQPSTHLIYIYSFCFKKDLMT